MHLFPRGLDAIGRVWDLRTGRTAMVLDGHVQPIFSMAFSPTGFVAWLFSLASILIRCNYRYQIATGAGDATIRIWDLRSLNAVYTIPAHVSNVSDIRFFAANDLYSKFKSSGIKMTDADDQNGEAHHDPPEKEFAYTDDEWAYRPGLFFASAGYDGSVKLWSADDWQLLKQMTIDAGKVMSVDISSDGNMIASGTYNRNFQLFAPE
jgi:U4/U6 small nuclear ribonucleoprotein PRP4